MSKSKEYRSHLIIGDSHSKPDESNDRFDWLGQLIIEKQPDVIIDLGDSADMASLCHYDRGTVRAEGRRYIDDINAYRDAMDRTMAATIKYNDTHTRWKKKKYRPHLVKLTGNHEHRITRAATETPALYGHIGQEDLQEEKHGWKVYDFLKPAVIDNICYKHYFTSGVMARPIGGLNHARSLLSKNHCSSICGHSHMRDFSEELTADGRKIFGLVAGCYFEHDEEYTTENNRFWRGLVMLNVVDNGTADMEFIGMNRIKEKYS